MEGGGAALAQERASREKAEQDARAAEVTVTKLRRQLKQAHGDLENDEV
jgi:hypothetical protein